eukprot:scaffold43493_cov72-Phaeocystis_antarctica.AAC.2
MHFQQQRNSKLEWMPASACKSQVEGCAPELVTEHVGVLGALEGGNKFGEGRCCRLLLACLVLRGGQQGRGVLVVRVELDHLRRGLQGLVIHLLLQQEHRLLQQALASQVRAAALDLAELQCPAVPAGLEPPRHRKSSASYLTRCFPREASATPGATSRSPSRRALLSARICRRPASLQVPPGRAGESALRRWCPCRRGGSSVRGRLVLGGAAG